MAGQNDINDSNNSPRKGDEMAKQILVRDVPDGIHEWIEEERHKKRLSQKEFVLQVLKDRVDSGQQASLFQMPRVSPHAGRPAAPFTFIDLFAGIGGFRHGLERVGGHCLFSCEWDHYAQKTYAAWFGETPHGDIRSLKHSEIPDHDVLAAGFPCQPFSIAGVSKKNSLGRAHGFKDATQGTMFFYLATLIESKRPPVIILENVKNLVSHDSGRTWNVISSTLRELGYAIFHKVVDAADYVPQHRERVIIVGFDRRIFGDSPPFEFPNAPGRPKPKLSDILEDKVDEKYTLTDHLWKYLQDYARKHQEKGNGFGFGMADPNGITRTLSARYYKDGSEILVPQGAKKNPRRLTPRECQRLMGFDDRLPIVVSDTQAYKQFGNAVVPTVVEAVGKQVVKVMCHHILTRGNRCLLKTGT